MMVRLLVLFLIIGMGEDCWGEILAGVNPCLMVFRWWSDTTSIVCARRLFVLVVVVVVSSGSKSKNVVFFVKINLILEIKTTSQYKMSLQKIAIRCL